MRQKQRQVLDEANSDSSGEDFRHVFQSVKELPFEEAKVRVRERVDRLLSNSRPSITSALQISSYGQWCLDLADLEEAEWAFRKAVQMLPDNQIVPRRVDWSLAELLRKQGSMSELLELSEALRLKQERAFLPDLSRSWIYRRAMIVWYHEQGDKENVDSQFRKAMEVARQRLPFCSDLDGSLFEGLLSDLIGFGKANAAEQLAADCLAAWREKRPHSHFEYRILNLYANALLENKKWEEAEPVLLEVQKHNAAHPDNFRGGLPRMANELMDRLYREWDDSENAP